jgi:hypothetical protein
MLDKASPLNCVAVDAMNWLISPFRPEAVCILHVGRVGSTVLADMLGRHPQIKSVGEIWNREHDKILAATKFENHKLSQDPFFPLKEKLVKSRRKILVFEIKFLHAHHMKMLGVDIDGFVNKMTQLGVGKFIILDRKNLLRRAISGVNLRESGVSHLKAGEVAQKKKKEFDVDSVPLGNLNVPLDDFIQHVRAGYADARRATSGYPKLELTYEDDLMNDPTVGYKKCCEFIGVTPKGETARLERTNPYPLIETLSNPEQVAAKLRVTGDEWMLHAE